MSQENVEIVRRVYEAVARRDTTTVLALYDADVEWDGTETRWAEVISGKVQWRGHEPRTWPDKWSRGRVGRQRWGLDDS